MAYQIPLIPAILLLLVLYARPAHAFGAGNIASLSKVEGTNWRHGDIEDTLLSLVIARIAGGHKFSKLDVKRVYFGNWLRDYSQAVDVGTVKSVSAEAIRIIIWVLGFMSFGYGTKEFEVTTDRLGCYRPEEHIDNPKDYADNVDARQYDARLRGPVDEQRELSVDTNTGMKNYISNERAGIMTSAQHVRDVFGRSIHHARQYGRSRNKADLYEALRLLGDGCHCLEDFSAHSNYVELALIEMGERNVFPHVGRRTQLTLPNGQTVSPLVTGTFGGVDFLHSVMGEFSDKITQSEIQELEGSVQGASKTDVSVLRGVLDQLPSGLLDSNSRDVGDRAQELQDHADAAAVQNVRISPHRPEEWTAQLNQISRQIYPILEWHDSIFKAINKAIEHIPVLPELIEAVEDAVTTFVYSLLAPFILPIITQIKTELESGSSVVLKTSREKQYIVFNDDYSSDPTHSMLSKDHFSNVLNEPAGKVASAVLRWSVPQIMAAWDDERVDVNRTLTRIINGVFHHPSMRQYGEDFAVDGRTHMFRTVEEWWRGIGPRAQDDLRDKLSREGVRNGRNHKEGVHDCGHGSGKPVGRIKPSSGAAGILGSLGGFSDLLGGGGKPSKPEKQSGIGKLASEAVGGGALGGIVGSLAGGLESQFLGGGGGSHGFKREGYNDDGSYTKTETAYAHEPSAYGDRFEQQQYSQTQYPGGGVSETYQRYDQNQSQGYGYEERRDTRQSYGRQEQTIESTYGGGGSYGHAERTEYGGFPGANAASQRENRGESREYYGDSYEGSKRHSYKKKDDSGDENKHKDAESDEERRRRREYKEHKEHKEHKEKKYKGHDSGSDSDDRKHRRKRDSGHRGDW